MNSLFHNDLHIFDRFCPTARKCISKSSRCNKTGKFKVVVELYTIIPIKSSAGSSGIHRSKERFIVLGFPHAVKQQFKNICILHRIEYLAQYPEFLQLIIRKKQFFLAGTGFLYIDCREQTAFSKLAVKIDFAVA